MSIEKDIQNLTSAVERLAAAVEAQNGLVVSQNRLVPEKDVGKPVEKAVEKPAGKSPVPNPATDALKAAKAKTPPAEELKPTLLQVKAALIAKLGALRETKGHDYALAAITKLRDVYTGGKPLAEEHAPKFAELLIATTDLE